MRIIGGRDFYDGGLALGRDEDVVFVRAKHSEAEVVRPDGVSIAAPMERIGLMTRDRKLAKANGNAFGFHYDNEVMRGDSRYRFTTACAWFAGKRYGGVRVVNRTYVGSRPPEERWFWSREEFEGFLGGIGVSLRRQSGFRDGYHLDASSIGDHFSGEGSEAERSWVIENGVAVAIWIDDYGQEGWKLNTDGLKSIDFVRVMDAYSAFQELSMFVGGVMTRLGNSMVEITDDKVKAAKHGFNDWSFRKMPGM